MKVFKTTSLQFRITITFIAITVIISIIFTFISFYRDRNQKTENLIELADFTAQRLSKSFAAPLWDLEMDNLKDSIRFEMGEKQIYAISVKDAKDEKIIVGAQRDNNWKITDLKEEPEQTYLVKKAKIEKDKETLGYLYIYFSSKYLDRELRGSIIASALMFAVLAVLLIVSLYISIRRIVIKPVNAVVGLTKKLDNGDLSARLEAGNDEIGVMIASINNFSANLQSAVAQINDAMKAVATGDLTQHITADLKGDLDELKENINRSILMLGATIAEVSESSESVQVGSEEISKSANALADGTTQQAAAIQEVSSSLNEFSGQTKANNDNASQAQQLSNQTLDEVKRGNSQMESMLNSIKEIDNTSSEVSNVIKVIDEIAFQTNLLALNAAVEAARAGKYGKGFAVVAEEVRNLAGRSAKAARNTTELIEASRKEVEKGVANADLTAAILNKISEGIDKTNSLVGEISAASKEQATGIEEINRGLNQINDIVQQNSSISEETASSSEELSSQATHLQKSMQKFRFDDR